MVSGGEFVGGGECGYHHMLPNGVGVGAGGIGVGPCFLVVLQKVEPILHSGEEVLSAGDGWCCLWAEEEEERGTAE